METRKAQGIQLRGKRARHSRDFSKLLPVSGWHKWAAGLDRRRQLWYHIDISKIVYVFVGGWVSIDCVEFCKALSDGTRQQILVLLLEGERCVGDIVDAFDMSQPTISHHLGILKQFKLVTSRKEGKLVFYEVNRDNMVECCGMLMAKFDADEACGA
jgi:DNA-binding transcriptional ArsR family regulator